MPMMLKAHETGGSWEQFLSLAIAGQFPEPSRAGEEITGVLSLPKSGLFLTQTDKLRRKAHCLLLKML